jgi:hypothetical protein
LLTTEDKSNFMIEKLIFQGYIKNIHDEEVTVAFENE